MIQLSSFITLILLFASCYAVRIKKSEMSNVCHVCTTLFIYRHWSNFFPNQMNDQAPPVDREDGCLSGISDLIGCSGPCFTLNATTVLNNGSRIFVGIARGCSDIVLQSVPTIGRYGKCDAAPINIDTNRMRYTLDAEWCYCNGAGCNAQADWSILIQGNMPSNNDYQVRPTFARRKLVRNSVEGNVQSPMFLLVCFLVRLLFR